MPGWGNGVLRWGYGAADSGAAGVFGGTGGDSLATMQLNPAALTGLEGGDWTLSGRGVAGQGTFRRNGQKNSLDGDVGVFPEAAVAWKLAERPVWIGLSVAPVSVLQADWNYLDVPAANTGVSYGELNHGSRFLAIKANVGLAWKINEHWSVGGSVGTVYSQVRFDAPFIFQSNPNLAGGKVDLDFETDGWAFAWDLGVVFEPTEKLKLAARFRPEIELANGGDAFADYSAQFPSLSDPFASYQASSRNTLPLTIGAGFSWQASDCLRIGGWAEWFQWSEAFDDFGVNLSGGSNASVNNALGTDAPRDQVPLDWEDRLVLALGVEYELNAQWVLRAGYRYGKSPIPKALVTPLNASINEQTVTVGVGWRSGDWRVDASYAVEFGGRQRVGESGYLASEYSNSSVDLTVHSFGLGVGRTF